MGNKAAGGQSRKLRNTSPATHRKHRKQNPQSLPPVMYVLQWGFTLKVS